jgi:hypothetical protein
MNTAEVASLFKQYVDDADATFMSDADAVVFLNQGYFEFFTMVAEQDSNVFTAEENYIALSNNELDLASPAVGNAIMGNTPAGTRLYRLMRVSQIDGNGDIRYYLQPARSLVEMRNDVNRFMLRGSKMLFSDTLENVKLEYVGIADTTFTAGNIVSGAGVFIDNLVQFHDLIALLACKHYAIKDFATNPVLMGQLQKRETDLKAYLQTGRSWGAQNSVVGTDELSYLGY